MQYCPTLSVRHKIPLLPAEQASDMRISPEQPCPGRRHCVTIGDPRRGVLMNSFQPHITVATVVENQDRLLLVRETADDRIVLNQPAGHVEAGETLPQAAFRETLEETGWQVAVTHLLGTYIYQPRRGAGIYYRFCFIAAPVSHDPRMKLDEGIIETVWLSPQELAARGREHRSPLVARCVEDYLAGRRLPLDTIYQHPWPLQTR